MNDISIRIENLGKQYRIGGKRTNNRTFREVLLNSFAVPTRWMRGERRSHEKFWALNDISFEIKQGEAIGIIGRNGAGKSTLLKILSRITKPTNGRVELYGRVASLLEVGTGFHSELSGRDNIYLNGAILGMNRKEINRKFDEIVDFSGVEEFLSTPVKHYSSGMYMRLAFAVAAHLDPEILVIDEVLAVGDAEFQKKCLGKMGDVAKGGRTVLFVSHNMVAVEELCPRAVVLDKGAVIFDGDSNEAIAHYIHAKNDLKSVALQHRRDRIGTGVAKVIDIKIINKIGEITNNIGMGEDFCVEIRTQGILDRAIIGILIGNIYRTQILRGYTWEQVTDNISLVGDDVIRCYFGSIPLMHGTYDIHVWLGQQNNCADYVENTIELVITPKDVFNSGRMLDSLGGMAFCKIGWKINGASLSGHKFIGEYENI
jgi:lipopolysaccharide transport system ATP-binding protein